MVLHIREQISARDLTRWLVVSVAGRQADRRYFTRICLEGADQHSNPDNASNRWPKSDIRPWMRQI